MAHRKRVRNKHAANQPYPPPSCTGEEPDLLIFSSPLSSPARNRSERSTLIVQGEENARSLVGLQIGDFPGPQNQIFPAAQRSGTSSAQEEITQYARGYNEGFNAGYSAGFTAGNTAGSVPGRRPYSASPRRPSDPDNRGSGLPIIPPEQAPIRATTPLEEPRHGGNSEASEIFGPVPDYETMNAAVAEMGYPLHYARGMYVLGEISIAGELCPAVEGSCQYCTLMRWPCWWAKEGRMVTTERCGQCIKDFRHCRP